MKPRSDCSGFTVVEIIICIAIAALIVMMTLPALHSSHKRRSAALSRDNLRQWGIALNLSLAENNNMLPSLGSVSGKADLQEPSAWFNSLPPYISQKPLQEMQAYLPRAGDHSIWINPMVPTSANQQFSPILFTYGMNSLLTDDQGRPLRITHLDNPSATVFMGEMLDNQSMFNLKTIVTFYGKGDPQKSPKAAAHFLYCDGHVEIVERAQFDPKLGANSMKNNPPDTFFTFVPFEGAATE